MEIQDQTSAGYFQARGVDPASYRDYTLPRHILDVLPADKAASILDIGCGYCQMLKSLRTMGYTRLKGVDLASDAVEYGLANNLDVSQIGDLEQYLRTATESYDLVLMSHVIEHIDKTRSSKSCA
jgi:2-polyprenyl-3-methyl-5-hydroxy-6-metoxy-1,4-benzoquinol methylase